MYRLLIVDDEEIIANGLYEIFRSLKHLDLDVYKAYSGEEAIEWLNRTRIDIVLTDIRMPEIDGLQLLEEIHKSWPRCTVIFLTGHSEFQYVYKAIQHPGVSYVLKTEDNEKVVKTVENAVNEIRKEMKTEDLICNAKEQMGIAAELFRKDFFLHLLHGDTSAKINDEQFDRLSITMNTNQPVFLILGNTDALSGEMTYWDRVEHLYSVRQIIDRYLMPHVNSLIVMDENNHFVIFVQPKSSVIVSGLLPDTSDQVYEKTSTFLRGTLESIQMVCHEALSTPISFVIGGEACAWDALSSKYFALKQLINYRIGTGQESVLVDNEFYTSKRKDDAVKNVSALNSVSDYLETVLRKKNSSIIEHYLESGQRDEYFDALDELLKPLEKIGNMTDSVAIQAFNTVSLVLLSYINRWRFTEKIALLHDQNKLIRADLFDNWGDASTFLLELSRKLFETQNEVQKRRADDTINFLRSFIESHLGEDLSLVKLAEQVFLNPSYLSRLYKQETGENLSEFIENERVKSAKQLLQDVRVKIHEVARRVGYENAASFTRFFRKAEGLSPQEFRDAHLLGNRLQTK